jgi:hypothetical protein
MKSVFGKLKRTFSGSGKKKSPSTSLDGTGKNMRDDLAACLLIFRPDGGHTSS